MGWSYSHVYGPIDRKAECDAQYTWESETRRYRVLKSAMVGSVWYGAVERFMIETGERTVFAGVILTHIDNSEYCNFGTKGMDETMGPCESRCPVGILNLLSPTDDVWALEWRERCRNYAKQSRELGRLPIGTTIEFMLNGSPHRFTKHAPAYQFKTPFWFDGTHYIKKTAIPENYTVVA